MYDDPKFLQAWKGTSFGLVALVLAVLAGSYVLQRPVGTDALGENTEGPATEQEATTTDETPVTVTPRPTVFEGTVICLPHKDTTGPQTMECAIGIDADDGYNYSLDLGENGSFADVAGGSRVRIEGHMTPAEALSNDQWQKYDMRGIISVESIEQI